MKRWPRLLGLFWIGLLLPGFILTGCPDLFESDDESQDAQTWELDPPYHLTAEMNQDGSAVLLTWNMDTSQEYDGFVIERGTASMNPQEIGTVGKTSLSYADDDALDAGTYTYRVGALQYSKGTVYCESVSVSVEAIDEGTAVLLEPPAWIQGTWTDQVTETYVYTFTTDNVVWEYSGTSVDCNNYNSSYSDQGSRYEDIIVDVDSYELHSYISDSLQTTYRFDQLDASSLTYTDGTSTLTFVK